MSMISDQSVIIEKTKDLCQSIVENEQYKSLMQSVETFLNDDEARLLYQTVHERSDELRNKQRSGVELGEAEIDAFKEVRGQMELNPIIMNFLAAQDELQEIQNTVGKFVGTSLELGRVPTQEDFAASEGGCCGGSGGGGCGC